MGARKAGDCFRSEDAEIELGACSPEEKDHISGDLVM